MTCQQTKRVCTAPTECGALGCVVVKNATPPPPPPTLAEMMRLMIELEDAAHDAAVYPNIPQCATYLLQTRAALMAAIRLYVQE